MDHHEQRASKFLTLLREKEDRLSRERKGRDRSRSDAFITATLAACLLAAGGLGYFSLDAKIKAAGSTANQVEDLQKEMAALDPRMHLIALGARIDELSVAKAQLEADVAQLTEDVETIKAGQKKPSPTRKQ
jgi:outer membrane murein-binding lipoprotein Lpp